MRRSDREITDKKSMEDIILKSQVCKLAMCDGDLPYIVPLCFGYTDGTLYFHSARKGKKIDILNKNPNVCFEFEIYTQLIKSAAPCKWGMKYKSVIGYGQASFIEQEDDKRAAFDIIMAQYANSDFTYEEKALEAAAIIRVDIDRMTGKQSDI